MHDSTPESEKRGKIASLLTLKKLFFHSYFSSLICTSKGLVATCHSLDVDFQHTIQNRIGITIGTRTTMVWFAGGIVLRSKSVEELKLFPPNGLEPAPLTSEALVVLYLHGSYSVS